MTGHAHSLPGFADKSSHRPKYQLYILEKPAVQYSTVGAASAHPNLVFGVKLALHIACMLFEHIPQRAHPMQSRSTTTAILLIILAIIAFPLILSIIGGVFGIIGGIFGALFGALFGVLGGLFGWMFHWHWPFFFHWNAFTVIAIAIIVVLISRSRKI